MGLPSHCPSLLTSVASRLPLISSEPLGWWPYLSKHQADPISPTLPRVCILESALLTRGSLDLDLVALFPEQTLVASRAVPLPSGISPRSSYRRRHVGASSQPLPAPAPFCREARELSTCLRVFDPRPWCCHPAHWAGAPQLWSLGCGDGPGDPHPHCCSFLLSPLCSPPLPLTLPPAPLSESIDHPVLLSGQSHQSFSSVHWHLGWQIFTVPACHPSFAATSRRPERVLWRGVWKAVDRRESRRTGVYVCVLCVLMCRSEPCRYSSSPALSNCGSNITKSTLWSSLTGMDQASSTWPLSFFLGDLSSQPCRPNILASHVSPSRLPNTCAQLRLLGPSSRSGELTHAHWDNAVRDVWSLFLHQVVWFCLNEMEYLH